MPPLFGNNEHLSPFSLTFFFMFCLSFSGNPTSLAHGSTGCCPSREITQSSKIKNTTSHFAAQPRQLCSQDLRMQMRVSATEPWLGGWYVGCTLSFFIYFLVLIFARWRRYFSSQFGWYPINPAGSATSYVAPWHQVEGSSIPHAFRSWNEKHHGLCQRLRFFRSVFDTSLTLHSSKTLRRVETLVFFPSAFIVLAPKKKWRRKGKPRIERGSLSIL